MGGDSVELTNEHIVCFGTGEWYHRPSVPEHTMSLLAQKNKVLYVEPFGSLLSVMYNAFVQRKKIRLQFGVKQHAQNLFVYSPPSIGLPFQHRFHFILRWNTILLSWLVKRAMRKLEFAAPILWIYLFRLHGLVGRFAEKVAIYDCIDQDAALLGSVRMRKIVQELESRLCQRADIVFVISPELYERKKEYNPATFVVRAGANYQHFHKAVDEETPVPSELLQFKRPIMGYFGQLDPWKLDVRLLLYLARKYPEWSIVLMGLPYQGFQDEALKSCPNIHLIGAKPYETLPSYLKGFDICLMPFLLNEVTLHGDHLKLYEYLAAGKPIVSTAVSSAKRFQELVWVAHSYEEFAQNVAKAYQKDTPALRRQRIAAAKENSWNSRVVTKSDVILRKLSKERVGRTA
jgi:glycosyltransferase involved in cell wall biosynthesis